MAADHPVAPNPPEVTRAELIRVENDRLVRRASKLRFVSRVPFMCECGAEDCREFVFLRIEDYYAGRESPLLTEGHRVA